MQVLRAISLSLSNCLHRTLPCVINWHVYPKCYMSWVAASEALNYRWHLPCCCLSTFLESLSGSGPVKEMDCRCTLPHTTHEFFHIKFVNNAHMPALQQFHNSGQQIIYEAPSTGIQSCISFHLKIVDTSIQRRCLYGKFSCRGFLHRKTCLKVVFWVQSAPRADRLSE